ncbi:helix-turn-helix transcriptional regulator [Kitasatospora purpeofusca]|uniref:helix-turn-helix transcriptional regulator n=1 Tax=Kitasatospora purpeofusca TaxID=67352 RepID=UPI0007C5517B|nr:helix-turn-helix transcriptional regulator [Kitasatospora purpeofusca]
MTVVDTPGTVEPAPVVPKAPATRAARHEGRTGRDRRRTELAEYLRACRARVSPEDVGLPPGLRRRTPGLRREEVAQLAGVGVTWYTWLEQGRPINASAQVLTAVARVLLLDATGREHLFRLAGVAVRPSAHPDPPVLDPSTQVILDALAPLPAAVSNSRFDVLAWNTAYEALFATSRPRTGDGWFNSLWCTVTSPECCNPFLNRAEQLPQMVAVLRGAYGKHVGEPLWEEYVRSLLRASAEFRELWARQEVSTRRTALKVFRHPQVGVMRLNATYLTIPGVPEAYVAVYTPDGPEDRARAERLSTLPPGGWTAPCGHRFTGPVG